MDLKPIKKTWDKVKANKRITYPVIGVVVTVTATASIVVPVVVSSKRKSQLELTRTIQEEQKQVDSISERDLNFMPHDTRKLHEAKNYKKPKDGTTKNGVVFQIKKWQHGDGYIDYIIELVKNNRVRKTLSGKLTGFATAAQVLEQHKTIAIQEFRNKYLITVKPGEVNHEAIKPKWTEYQDELSKHIDSIQNARTYEEVRGVLTDGARERVINSKISAVTEGINAVREIIRITSNIPSEIDIAGYENYSLAKFVLKTRDPERARKNVYLIKDMDGTTSVEPVVISVLNNIDPKIQWWISKIKHVDPEEVPVLLITLSMEYKGLIVNKEIKINGLGTKHKEYAEKERQKIYKERAKKLV